MNSFIKVLLLLALLPIATPVNASWSQLREDYKHPRNPLLAALATGLLTVGGGAMISRTKNRMRALERELTLAKLAQVHAQSSAEFDQIGEHINRVSHQISGLRRNLWWYGIPTGVLAALTTTLGGYGIYRMAQPATPGIILADADSVATSPEEVAPPLNLTKPAQVGALATALAGQSLPGARKRTPAQDAEYAGVKRTFQAAGVTDPTTLKKLKKRDARQAVVDEIFGPAADGFPKLQGEQREAVMAVVEKQAGQEQHQIRIHAQQQATAQPEVAAVVAQTLPERIATAQRVEAAQKAEDIPELAELFSEETLPSKGKTPDQKEAAQGMKAVGDLMQLPPRKARQLYDKKQRPQVINQQFSELDPQKRLALVAVARKFKMRKQRAIEAARLAQEKHAADQKEAARLAQETNPTTTTDLMGLLTSDPLPTRGKTPDQKAQAALFKEAGAALGATKKSDIRALYNPTKRKEIVEDKWQTLSPDQRQKLAEVSRKIKAHRSVVARKKADAAAAEKKAAQQPVAPAPVKRQPKAPPRAPATPRPTAPSAPLAITAPEPTAPLAQSKPEPVAPPVPHKEPELDHQTRADLKTNAQNGLKKAQKEIGSVVFRGRVNPFKKEAYRKLKQAYARLLGKTELNQEEADHMKKAPHERKAHFISAATNASHESILAAVKLLK